MSTANRFSRTTMELPPLIAPAPDPAAETVEESEDTAPAAAAETTPAVEEAMGEETVSELPAPKPHLDFPDDESGGIYKVAVEIPAAFDEALTAALIGKRWAKVGKKVGKLVVLRSIVLAVLRRVDFSEFAFTDPEELEDQILRALLNQTV